MRTLKVSKPLMQGPDVVKLQRLLKNAGYLAGAIDGQYGPETAAAVYRAKLLLGYPKPDHAAADVLLGYLEGRRHPTVAMRKRGEERKHVAKTKPGETSASAGGASPAVAREAAIRSKAVAAMRVMIAAEPHVHYAQIRPMRTRDIDSLDELKARLAHGGSITLDCSESATLIARVSGAKDPNGRRFSGVGYTGTILESCRPTTKARLKPGDLVVFGPGTGHHVCSVLAGGPDPLLFSHGQERGPFAILLSQEARYQAAPVRYLELPI